MKKNLISCMEIAKCHLGQLPDLTDADYAEFANLLLHTIEEAKVAEITKKEEKTIAINLTMYYEDVIADSGIWRSFTSQVHSLYGKYLPFYAINEKTYLQDEPNIEDVKFLIWYTLVNSRRSSGEVFDPEAPFIEQLSGEIFDIMVEWFEKMPINETLQEVSRVSSYHVSDFYEMRDVLEWLCYDCYLTRIVNQDEVIREEAGKVVDWVDKSMTVAKEAVKHTIPFRTKVGPLALSPQKWFSMILKNQPGQEECELAWDIEAMDCEPFGVFEILDADENDGMTLMDVYGEEFYISNVEMEYPPSVSYSSKGIISSFVMYKDRWFLNADSLWTKEDWFDSAWKKVEREWEKKNKKYTEQSDLLSNGLVDEDKFRAYWKRKRGNLKMALEFSSELLKGVVEQNLLPNLRLKAIGADAKRGKQLFRENYDFLARCLARENYEDVEVLTPMI